MGSKIVFSLVLIVFSINSKMYCTAGNKTDTPIVSFKVAFPNIPTSDHNITEVKPNQFHIMKKVDVSMECLSPFPNKIIFSGIMPNDIKYTSIEWNRTSKLYRVSIGFQNNPQATGLYTCLNADNAAAPNETFKSTIYIFADDGISKINLLHWKVDEIKALATETEILLPCITFKPTVQPKLYFCGTSGACSYPIELAKENYKYDPTKGYLVNLVKSKYNAFECILHSTEPSNLKFNVNIPDVTSEVNNYIHNGMGEVNKDELIYWPPGNNQITMTCKGAFPVKFTINGYKYNNEVNISRHNKMNSQHKIALGIESKMMERSKFYYKHVATISYADLRNAQLHNGTIACHKPQSQETETIVRKWFVVIGDTPKPTLRTISRPIKYNEAKNVFYCSNSSDVSPSMFLINCHNIANCDTARRFDPSQITLMENKYPYPYKRSDLLADRYLKRALDVEQNDECAVIQPDPTTKLGVVLCLLVKKTLNSQEESSLASLQYYYDLNDQIVELETTNTNYNVANVLRMKSNKTEVYYGETVNFTCEASIFVFAKGLEFAIKHRNGSTTQQMRNPNPRKAVEYSDSYKIALRETIFIWSKSIVEVECNALRWNSKKWEKVSQKFEVKDSKRPEISVDGYNNTTSSSIINITFHHNETHKNSITCTATGIPLPTLEWVKVESLGTNPYLSVKGKNVSTRIGIASSTLVFTEVKSSSEEYYICIAKNAVGESNRTFFITFDTSGTSDSLPKWVYYAAGGVIGVVMLLLLLTVALQCRSLKSKQNEIEKLSEVEIHHFINGNEDLVKRYQELHEVAQYLPYKQQYEIHRSKIEIKNEILGTGNSGMVLKGVFEKSGKKFPVAVKTVKSGTDISHLRSLLSELKIMMYIGKHPFIIEMLGALTKELREGTLFVAVEFCSNGNMQDYLRLCRPVFQNQIVDDEIKIARETRVTRSPRRFLGIEDAITNVIEKRRSRNSHLPPVIKTTNLIHWCYQIANGMDFLASKKVIHGDLAARNVLITDKLSVKITDFGLARHLYEYSNYVTKNKTDPVPWRWLSIEAIQDSKFSTQSDIWAYGITLWEIFSLGETPYQGFFWGEEFVQDLVKGYRMSKPQYATEDILNTMLECWNAAPQDRPSFQDISNNFKELLERMGVWIEEMEATKTDSGGTIPGIFISTET